jgi:hypothetical protein
MKGGGWQFQETKRTGSRRTVKLQNAVCRILQEHFLAQDEERLDAGETWKENSLVFATRTGGPLDERNIAQENFARIRKPLNSRRFGCTTSATPPRQLP